MDWQRPYRAVMPGLHGDVLHELTVLEASDGASGRELARRLEASPEGVRRVLLQLVDAGLALSEELPPARRYRINAEHLLYPAVRLLVGVRDRLFHQIAAVVESWDPPPISLAAYGSAARADGSTASDLDLLVLAPDDVAAGYYTWHSTAGAELLERIGAWTGNRAELSEYRASELADRARTGDSLIRSIARDAVTIFGEDLGTLLKTPRDQRS